MSVIANDLSKRRGDIYSSESHPEFQCRAKSKRSGLRCRRAAMRGKRVCYIHGGKYSRVDLIGAPRSVKAQRKAERLRAVATMVERPLLPETHDALRQYLDKLAPGEVHRFSVELDRLFRGEIDARAWADERRRFLR